MASTDPLLQRRIQLLRMFNEEAQISKTLGMVLSYNESDAAVLTRAYDPSLNTSYGIIHGGVTAIMCDTAMWFAAAIRHDPKIFLVTSDMTVHYIKNAGRSNLKCVATVISHGARQSVVEAYVYNDKGESLVHAVGTFVTVGAKL